MLDQGLSQDNVQRARHLEGVLVAINRMNGNAEPLHHSGVIGDGSVDFRVCTLKNVAGEALRRLHGPQRVSRHRCPQRGIATHRSDRVDERYDGNDGCVAVLTAATTLVITSGGTSGRAAS